MKRFDILTPFGMILGILVFAFGVISSKGVNGFLQFIDIPSIIIVFGGLTAALCISFPLKELKQLFVVIRQAFSHQDFQLGKLIDLFAHLSDRARRDGLLSLEVEIEKVDDPFIKKGILLAIDGIDPDIIIDIMTAEISVMEERHRKGRSILEKAGEYAPSWGMIGTLIGLILMLNDLNDPDSIGPSMAVAIITTLYGSLLANLFFLPLAAKLADKTEREVFVKQVIVEGIIGVQSGQNPKLLTEKLSAFISQSDLKLTLEEYPGEEG